MNTTVGVPYSQRKREAVAQALPRVALTATDTYVTSASLMGWGAETGITPFLSGGLAVFHGISAINFAVKAGETNNSYYSDRGYKHSEPERKRLQLMSVGSALTAVGMAGLTFGLGYWALPVIALGEVTTNFARFT